MRIISAIEIARPSSVKAALKGATVVGNSIFNELERSHHRSHPVSLFRKREFASEDPIDRVRARCSVEKRNGRKKKERNDVISTTEKRNERERSRLRASNFRLIRG